MVVALGMQHERHMRRIMLSSVASVALPYFPTLSHKRHDFWKKLLKIKCLFRFSLQVCLKHFSLQEELCEILLQMYIGVYAK